MVLKYPRQLSAGTNDVVIALSETEAAKLYVGDTRSDIGSEAEKMKFANAVNGLVCRYLRLDFHENLQAEITGDGTDLPHRLPGLSNIKKRTVAGSF